MPRLTLLRRGLKWAFAALAGLILVLTLLIAALDAGYWHAPLVRLIGARVGREIQVGSVHMHLFSLHPQVIAERVSIGNPRWTPSGITAEVGKIVLVFSMPGSDHRFGIDRLEMQSAVLYLKRDSTGHANWQRFDPDTQTGAALPLMRSLSIPQAHVLLEDGLKHLQFDGTVSAEDGAGAQGTQPLRLYGTGQLNGRAVALELTGEALATASRAHPYQFRYTERSGGSTLRAEGAVLRPFDLTAIEATFDAAGPDLKDLYYVVGSTFVHTMSYRLSGKLVRSGDTSTYQGVALNFGQSDVRGSVSIQSSRGRFRIQAKLYSQLLRLADFAPDPNAHLLLSNAMFDPATLRRNDGDIDFRAARLAARSLAMEGVAATVAMDRGVLTGSLLGELLGGKLTSRVKIDATSDLPAVTWDLKADDLQLGQLPRKQPAAPAADGPLQARATVTGRGKSLHQVAASANGVITATLERGIMRASLAEILGTDLRAAGLLFEKSRQEVAIRCAAASFEAHAGALSAKTLLIDTDSMLISGTGGVNLDTEDLDMELRGQPKELRILRLRAPLKIGGTLKHPSFSIQAHNAAPLLIDRGRARDVDCAALLANPASAIRP
jgi:AsmA family protein